MEESKVIIEAKVYYDKAIKCIQNKNVSEFSINLKIIYDILPSGFYSFVNVDEFEKLLHVKRYHKDELIRGFLLTGLNRLDEAIIAFNWAISMNYHHDDLPYLLRGSFPLSLNPFRIHDIVTALTIRQSSRAYYLFYSYAIEDTYKKLGNSYKTIYENQSSDKLIDVNESYPLFLLNKIIDKTEDPVVYLLRSSHQVSSKAIESDILKSYSIDANYNRAIFKASILFFKNKEYEKALECYLKLEKIDIRNDISIANCYFNLKQYSKALNYYNLAPVSLLTSKVISLDKFDIQREFADHTNDNYYSNINYNVKDFFRYFAPDYTMDDSLLHYFICLLKEKQPNFIIDENHPLYIKLLKLRHTFFNEVPQNFSQEVLTEKLNEGKLTNDEVYAGKMMLYGMNHKISFGKYSGRKISEILQVSPDDLIEYIINLIHFSVDPVIFINDKIKLNSQYYYALETNFVKIKILAEKHYDEQEDDDEYWHDDSYDGDSYYDGGGGNEWSDPFQFGGG